MYEIQDNFQKTQRRMMFIDLIGSLQLRYIAVTDQAQL